MGEPAAKLMTVDEFLRWEDGTDRRFELSQGQLVLMAPAARPHRALAARIAQHLNNRLRLPCLAESEAGILLPWSGHDFYVADLAVSCTPLGRELWCPDPVLIVEIPSPSTEGLDRTVKLRAYRRLPSVQDILLVSSVEVAVEHYARADDRWHFRDLGSGDGIRLAGLGIELPVDALYAGLDLGPPSEATGA